MLVLQYSGSESVHWDKQSHTWYGAVRGSGINVNVGFFFFWVCVYIWTLGSFLKAVKIICYVLTVWSGDDDDDKQLADLTVRALTSDVRACKENVVVRLVWPWRLNERCGKWSQGAYRSSGASVTTKAQHVLLSDTPSVSFYMSLDSVKLHYLATNKKKRREYIRRH
jgi:hypothetical protein